MNLRSAGGASLLRISNNYILSSEIRRRRHDLDRGMHRMEFEMRTGYLVIVHTFGLSKVVCWYKRANLMIMMRQFNDYDKQMEKQIYINDLT
mmetsp:Transcript_22266/g.30375  ORF Transcript_22266/g.30375 Transcript_22266/m.30375 type:complete len:92 (+) Transcript_22266:689-964(+)